MQLLAATDPVPAKFVSIPLAKIAYRNEIFELVEYMSPACQVALNSPVGIMCSTTVRRLRERAIYLSEQLRTFSASGRNQLEAQQKTRIRGLVTGLPAFEALLSTGLTHPYHLYVAYCALAGQISVLGTTMITPLFPPYNHSELMESFGEVDRYINAVVREGIPEDYVPIPFVYKNGIFLLNFEADWAERRLILSVRCPPGVPHLDVLAWGEQSLIGSAELQRGMREKRVLGAPRHYLADEEGLVAGQGVVLYHLVYDPEYIRPNETLQVVGINSEGQNVRPSEIVLYVKHANN
jgi:type VI secretion system protein ImpJ